MKTNVGFHVHVDELAVFTPWILKMFPREILHGSVYPQVMCVCVCALQELSDCASATACCLCTQPEILHVLLQGESWAYPDTVLLFALGKEKSYWCAVYTQNRAIRRLPPLEFGCYVYIYIYIAGCLRLKIILIKFLMGTLMSRK